MRAQTRTDYIQASVERLKDSQLLIDNQAFAGAIYYSGLAAESAIKAFIVDKDEEIKGHNLAKLAFAANFARRFKPTIREQVNAAISEATPMWRNLFRYSSLEDLDRMGLEFHLRFQVGTRTTRYADLGNDRIEMWSKRLFDLSSLIVQEGNRLWQYKKH